MISKILISICVSCVLCGCQTLLKDEPMIEQIASDMSKEAVQDSIKPEVKPCPKQ